MNPRWRISTVLVALAVGAGTATTPAEATTPTPTTYVVGGVVDGSPPIAGSPLSLNGALVTSDGSYTPVPDEPVRIQVRPYGQPAFHTVATVMTTASGSLAASYTPRYSFTYRFVFAGDGAYGPSSFTGHYGVRPTVSLWLSTREVRRGGRFVARGRTGPHRAGHLVRVYQGLTNRGAYGPAHPAPVLLASGRVHPDGRYELVAHARWTGNRRVFAQVSGGGGNTTGWSRYRWVAAR